MSSLGQSKLLLDTKNKTKQNIGSGLKAIDSSFIENYFLNFVTTKFGGFSFHWGTQRKYLRIPITWNIQVCSVVSKLPCVIDHRRRQNVVRTSVPLFLYLPHFDVICDLLLNRRTAICNLFVNLWRAFPVNIQTTLIYNTSITFLCHIFYFLSVYLLFCFFIFHFASIFFISLPINLYIRV